MWQTCLQPAQRLANVVRDLSEMNSRQIVTRLDPEDLVRVQEKDLSVHLNADSVLPCIELADVLEERAQLRRYGRLRRLLQALLRAIERLMKTNVIDGLEQIVERAKLERGNRVIIESRDENDGRHLVGADLGNHIEAIELRHLHVEEYQIGLVHADGGNGLESVLTFANDFDVRDSGEE